MNPIVFVLFQVDMPDPPDPGGSGAGEWWRIAGLIIMTILTTGILALIFRVPAVVGEGDESSKQHDLNAPPPLMPLRRAGDPPLAPVITFPGRGPAQARQPEIDLTAIAAAERLRRLTRSQSGIPSLERRRLGARRVVRQLPSHGAAGTVQAEDRQIPTRERNAEPNDLDETRGTKRSGENVPAPETADRIDEEGNDEMAGSPDALELLGDLAERLPSEADQLSEPPAGTIDPDDLDLLGDIANRAPSAVDRVVDESTRQPTIMRGDVPTADEVDRIAKAAAGGKIVQFVPRQSAQTPADELDPVYQLLDEAPAQTPEPVDRVITQFPVDPSTREGVASTVQELLFCANVGEFMHGFALYTDKFLFRFMVDSGLNEDEFRERYSNVPPKDPELWTRIEAIRDFRRLDDGRVSANVRYLDGGVLDGMERFVFKHDPITARWLIDDIQAVD